MEAKDISGQKFGRLTAIKLSHIKKTNHGTRHFWVYKCECGKIVTLNKNNVSQGHTQSCGCFQREQAKKAQTKHNLYGDSLYKIYYGMVKRTKNKKFIFYKYYGGRGITICDEWKNDFMAFYNWAINNGYKEEKSIESNRSILSIDRIDVNGNYCPENCRWVGAKTQARNTRTNKRITYKNETHCISEWAEILNVNPKLLGERLRLGWSFERAISENPEDYKKRNEKLIEYNGEFKTKKEWLDILQIHSSTFYRKIKNQLLK